MCTTMVHHLGRLASLDFEPVPVPTEELRHLVRWYVIRDIIDFHLIRLGFHGYTPFAPRIFGVNAKITRTAPDVFLGLEDIVQMILQ